MQGSIRDVGGVRCSQRFPWNKVESKAPMKQCGDVDGGGQRWGPWWREPDKMAFVKKKKTRSEVVVGRVTVQGIGGGCKSD